MGVNEHFEPIYNTVACQLRDFKTASQHCDNDRGYHAVDAAVGHRKQLRNVFAYARALIAGFSYH
jgi:hypothetical protein